MSLRHVICLVGMPGTGKTTLGRCIAQLDNRIKLISNDELRARAGYPWDDSAFTTQTYDLMASAAEQFLCSDMNVVLDATFYRRSYRRIVLDRLQRLPVFWTLIRLNASDHTCRERVRQRILRGAPDAEGMNSLDRFEAVLAGQEPFELAELPNPNADIAVATDVGIKITHCSGNAPNLITRLLLELSNRHFGWSL